MSTADEIAKLEELRRQGTITEKEFSRQKSRLLKPKRWYSSWWIRISVGLIGLYLLLSDWHQASQPGQSSFAIPLCNSSDARILINNVLENNTSAGVAKLELLDLTQIREVSSDAENQTRSCHATATTNIGITSITYRMWLSSDKKTILIKIDED